MLLSMYIASVFPKNWFRVRAILIFRNTKDSLILNSYSHNCEVQAILFLAVKLFSRCEM